MPVLMLTLVLRCLGLMRSEVGCSQGLACHCHCWLGALTSCCCHWGTWVVPPSGRVSWAGSSGASPPPLWVSCGCRMAHVLLAGCGAAGTPSSASAGWLWQRQGTWRLVAGWLQNCCWLRQAAGCLWYSLPPPHVPPWTAWRTWGRGTAPSSYAHWHSGGQGP